MFLSDLSAYENFIKKTSITNVDVLPRGPIPPNPSELLNSKKNLILLEILKKEYDLILLDGAPILGLADSLILSKLVDKVILVASIGNTPKTELINNIKSLQSIGANIMGVVLNNLPINIKGYGNYYSYYANSKETINEKNIDNNVRDLPRIIISNTNN